MTKAEREAAIRRYIKPYGVEIGDGKPFRVMNLTTPKQTKPRPRKATK